MNKVDKIAVCSRSFSQNLVLRAELLRGYQNVKFNDHGASLAGDSLVEFLNGCDKAITALEKIDAATLERLPKLKVIAKYGVGLDMIDQAAMRKYGRRLGWIGGVNRRSVSELVVAFAITMLRNLPIVNYEVRGGKWSQLVGGLLTNRTVGIIGCGHVGKDLVKLLMPFDCKLLVNDIENDLAFNAAHNIQAVALPELVANSDIVTLHVPLDSGTQNIISAEILKSFKSSAILINTARGGLVDEVALRNMLESKRLHAAAFDVFSMEPPVDTQLLNLPNFFATPHIGGSSEEAILAMGRAAIYGLENNHIPDER